MGHGKVIKPLAIKKADVIDVIEETIATLDPILLVVCEIAEGMKPSRVITTEVSVKKCEKEKNFIYKNSKYFCRSCNIDICNDCFTSGCSAHDVQWLGSSSFSCLSPQHSRSSS